MAIEKSLFRQIMGYFATGVTVVTTSSQGTLGGLTVNAFCSVSLNPPLVLVCVDTTSNTLPLIRESGVFAVNMLADDQENISRCFAMPSIERYEHFCHAAYHVAATGAPILDGILAFVDVRVVAEYPAGDHVIFLGQVEAMGTDIAVGFAHEADQEHSTLVDQNGTAPAEEKLPLGYYRGQYRHFNQKYRKPSLAGTYSDEHGE